MFDSDKLQASSLARVKHFCNASLVPTANQRQLLNSSLFAHVGLKPSSTDLMAFLLQESLGCRRRWRRGGGGGGGVGWLVGVFWAKRIWTKAKGELTFLPNQKQKAGFSFFFFFKGVQGADRGHHESPT